MIRAIAENGNAVIALSREDVEKLISGKNIILLSPQTLPGLRHFILLAGGETQEDIVKKLEGLAAPAPGRPK